MDSSPQFDLLPLLGSQLAGEGSIGMMMIPLEESSLPAKAV